MIYPPHKNEVRTMIKGLVHFFGLAAINSLLAIRLTGGIYNFCGMLLFPVNYAFGSELSHNIVNFIMNPQTISCIYGFIAVVLIFSYTSASRSID
jgi:uncharacterized membrane protein YkvI